MTAPRTYFGVVLLVMACAFRDDIAAGPPDGNQPDLPELVLQIGHTGDISSIAFSPDGRLLASGSYDETIKIWDTASGRELRSIDGAELGKISAIAFSPDGHQLLGASLQDGIALWDVTTGKLLRSLPGHSVSIFCSVFSPDGNLLASAGKDDTMRIRESFTGHEVYDFKNKGMAYSVAFSSDGRLLASAGADHMTVLWDVAKRKRLRVLRGHSKAVLSVAFSPDDRLLATGSSDGTARLWEVTTGREILKLLGPADRVKSVAFSRDGRMLAAGSLEGRAKLWDMATRKERAVPTEVPGVDSIVFSPDGNLLATGGTWLSPDAGSMEHSVALWDVASGGNLKTMRGVPEIQSIAYSKQRLLATANFDGSISLWDMDKGRKSITLRGHSAAVESVAFSSDGGLLASASRDGTVKIWDAINGQVIRTLMCSQRRPWFGVVAFSSDGRFLAAAGSVDNEIRLWHVDSWLEQSPLRGHNGLIRSLAFSPGGRLLASGSWDNTVKLWDLASGRELLTLPWQLYRIESLAFSRDGHWLACGSWGQGSSGYTGVDTIKVWDIWAGREAQNFINQYGAVASVAFSPDGRWLAAATMPGTVALWDAEQGGREVFATFDIPNETSITFSSDGRWLVSGGLYGASRILNVSSGQLIATMISMGGSEDWIVVTPDGLFDGPPEAWNRILWRFGGSTFDVLPVEIFTGDFYIYKLLPKVLGNGQRPEVRQIASLNLASLNRTQPLVRILGVETDSDGLVTVPVQVASTQSETQKDSQGRPLQSGVYDVRLFRDGQKVGQWPEVEGVEKAGPIITDEDREMWRRAHHATLDANGRATITFHNVRLPQRAGVQKVVFTAYAFNSDRVKSLTTPPFEYSLPKTSDSTPPDVLRRAYLITMGVNANQSHNLDLEVAVSSAERALGLLRSKLAVNYSEVVEIPLYSDLDAESNQIKLKAASKVNVEAVLDLLAGRSVNPSLRDEVDPKHQLQAARPDDAVVLYVASHGYADPQGTFYVMPYDTGSNWGITEDLLTHCQTHPSQSTVCKQAEDLLAHSVSSSDLTAWWNGVDAGEMVMILDSCHSGAVPGKEFRPGPLGDPGFGQLSYDKGMQILSASQPAQTEQGEWVKGGEGRTLLVDALETVAKTNPGHTLEQWLQDTEQQLPVTARQLYPTLKEEDVQLPVLLDFGKKTNITTSAVK